MDHKAGVKHLPEDLGMHVCARALGWSENKLWMQKPRCLCCRKRDPFQSPKVYSCLTLRNESSEETHVLTKQGNLLEKGTQAESRKVRGTQQGCSTTCPSVLGFMGMGLVSGFFPATPSESGCFLVAHALLSQDGFQ